MQGLKIGAGIFVIGIFVALAAAFGAFYTVDSGERAVVLRYGAVTDTSGPGLHFKVPFIDSVETISTRTFTLKWEQEPFYSRDQQAATADISVTFSAVPDSVADIYTQFGDLDTLAQRILTPRIKKEVKEVMGQFRAETAITDREKLGVEVSKAISENLHKAIVVESVQLENIDFSNAYEEAIEQRMLAEVEISKITQNAEREKKQAEIAVIQAQAAADSKRAVAQADADAIKLRGEAEADAIKARAAALGSNPALVELTKAERWNGTLPTTVLPNGTVPFIEAVK